MKQHGTHKQSPEAIKLNKGGCYRVSGLGFRV